MKRIATAFALIGIFIFQACEGPEGPQGFQGPQGLQGLQGPQGLPGESGVNIVGTTIEVENVTFLAKGNYAESFNFTPPILESDVILVYRLSKVDDNGKDQWTNLPETHYLNEDIFTYGFEFTTDGFVIFMDGKIDFRFLGSEWTDNQIFRIVVVPSDFSQGRIDYSDYEGVMKLLGIEDKDFIKINSKK